MGSRQRVFVFHSYGYQPELDRLTLDPKLVYHFNPLDAQQIGKLCREHQAISFMATPNLCGRI